MSDNCAMGAEHDGDRFVVVGDYWYELVDDDSGDEPDVTTPAGHLAASFSRIAGRPLTVRTAEATNCPHCGGNNPKTCIVCATKGK
jgi:hypothetical protein